MLEDVDLGFNLFKIFVQHRAILLVQQCSVMLASFEQAIKLCLIMTILRVMLQVFCSFTNSSWSEVDMKQLGQF